MKIRNFALICLSVLFGHVYAQTATDYSTLYTRIFNSDFVSVASYDLTNLKSDGTFANVTYPTVQPTVLSGVPRAHLDEMYKIACAYQTAGPDFHSATYLAAYLKAWNWWFKYDPKDTNWWYRSIGWPKSLSPSFVLMGRDIKAQYPTDYANMITYFKHDWTPTLINTYATAPTGANTTDVCDYIMAMAIVDQDAATINKVMEIINNVLSVVTGVKAEGIQPDYGFSQHNGYGRQLQMGNYGKVYVGGIVGFLTLTAGTYFQIPDSKVEVLENLFLNGVSWNTYRNIFDQNQYGRFPEADYYSTMISQLSKIISANTRQKAALQSLYGWMTRSSATNSQNVQTGNRMFWRHDFMIQKGKDYMVSTRMTSTRTVGCESGNGGGLKNYYTGSGVNYLYVTGKERYETLTDQNWRRLPGVTAPQKPTTTALPLVDWGLNSPNLDAYAGGVSDGKTGACGFIYNKNQTETNVKAYKSYFYFPDYYVALGSGISAGTNYLVPYATTVNQVKYNGSFVVDKEGVATSLSASQTLKPTSSNWAYLNNVGYHFLINNELNYETATLGATPIAWIGLNHGNLPVNDQYAYAVYPNIAQDSLLAKVANPPFSIISNMNFFQGVLDKSRNIAQIVFYKPGKATFPNGLGTCQVNSPAVVQLRWTADSVFVSAANPYCETTPLTSLTVTISGAFCNAGSVTGSENVLNINMPQNEYQGMSVTSSIKKLTTGLPNTTKLEISIHPNQVKAGNPVTVYLSGAADLTENIQIYNLSGKLVKQLLPPSNDLLFTIDTAGMTTGFYVLKYKNFIGKLIIN